MCVVFFFKQKTAYEMRISDWSSDVFSSDLTAPPMGEQLNDLWDQQHPADCLAALDVAVGGGGFGKREGPVDDRLQFALGHVADQLLDVVVNPVRADLRAQEDAGELAAAAHPRPVVHLHRLAPGLADHGDAPAVGQRQDRAPLSSEGPT